MLATQLWKTMVEEEHAQAERMRGPVLPSDDHWLPYAAQFRTDPWRSDDPVVNRLLQHIAPHHTVIDVGAGAGRLAIPLALRCRQVVAIEPSPSMASMLLQQGAEYGIPNVSLVQSRWEEAEVAPADIVLCAHVLYIIRDIEPFVRKLEAHGRERVLVALYKTPPQSQIYPLWERIHGTKRLPLPSFPQFQEVLGELGIDAQVELLPPQPHRGFNSVEEAKEQLSRRLYLLNDSYKRALLEELVPELLEEEQGIFRIRNAQPLESVLVWWHPTISRTPR